MLKALTLGGFGACPDALLEVDNLLPLHHDVLQALVVGVEAMLQQLAESHRTAGDKGHRGGENHVGAGERSWPIESQVQLTGLCPFRRKVRVKITCIFVIF